MANSFWHGGENDGGGETDGGGENDGGGRVTFSVGTGAVSRPSGPAPFNPGPLPGWDALFDDLGLPKFVAGASFPADGWDPAIEVDRLAVDFAVAGGWKEGTAADPGPPPGHFPLNATEAQREESRRRLIADVEALLLLKQELLDSGRRSEIAYQAGGILPYYMKLASCSPSVRPATHFLLLLCLRVAAIVARHYKRTYMRARPVQVIPSLDTVIPTPRHPSYPSGHALQSHLMAAALEAVAPALGARGQVLADRIALNRELAGVHFRADSQASARIAPAVWICFAAGAEVQALIAKAKAEHSGTEQALPKDCIARIEAPAREAAERGHPRGPRRA